MPINLSNNIVVQSGFTNNGDYTDRIIRDDLKIYLDAANPNSWTGSGNWLDLSGYGNDCVWGTAPSFVDQYFNFTGTQAGTITANSSLDGSKNQTVMMVLMKTNSAARRNPWNRAYGGYGTWTDEIAGTTNYYFGDAGDSTDPYVSSATSAISLNTWKILTASRNLEKQLTYKNGIQESEVTNPYGQLTTDNNNITIGNGYAGPWIGRIALVLMYTRALHPYEVAVNFQAIRGRFGL